MRGSVTRGVCDIGRVKTALSLACLVAVAAVAGAGCAGDTTVTVAVTVQPPTTVATVTAPTTPTTPTTPTSTAETVDRPEGFPRPAEAALLAEIPSGVADRCTRATQDNVSRGASASLFCDVKKTEKVIAYYETFPSTSAMQSVYRKLREQFRIDLDSGSCLQGESLPRENDYFLKSRPNQTQGRLMCFKESDGDIWYVSSEVSRKTMFWVSGKRRKDVQKFWDVPGSLPDDGR
jgi:hypothetical protein